MEALISVKDLVKTYDTGEAAVYALRGVSVDIQQGDFIAVMGASGSGKSTFMNIIGCLDTASSGTYFLDGLDVFHLSSKQLADLRNKKLGFIFQSFNILPRTSALENVELPLIYNNQVSGHERRERSLAALKAVGLESRVHSYPNQLSGGQQQRVAIARALVNEPVVILADEPTGNLDSKTSYEIMEIFQRLNNQGRTIVMVTHEPDIADFAKNKIVFKDGQIISVSPIENRKNATEELKVLKAQQQVRV